jgi:hypothetical protein
MNCKAVERWLDRGMPENGRERVKRHVAVCGACFEAFEAAASLESALRAEAGRAIPAALAAPAGAEFVANVMTRVAIAEPLARGARADRRRAAVWIALVTDPLSVVSITAAFLVAVLSAWHPSWFFDAGMNLVARWWWPAVALSPGGRIELDTIIWLGIAIAASPIVLWAGWALYRRFERTLLLLAARPRG